MSISWPFSVDHEIYGVGDGIGLELNECIVE